MFLEMELNGKIQVFSDILTKLVKKSFCKCKITSRIQNTRSIKKD